MPPIVDHDKSLSVGSLMQRRPETISVFLRHNMFCVGCSVSMLHTLDEVAAIYGQDPGELRRELCAVIRETGPYRRTRRVCAVP